MACSECDLRWGWAVLGSAPAVSEGRGDGEGFTEEGEEEAGGRVTGAKEPQTRETWIDRGEVGGSEDSVP